MELLECRFAPFSFFHFFFSFSQWFIHVTFNLLWGVTLFQPQFDHNLRTRQGDTPLMTACAAGKLQVLKFLLESAVYPPPRLEADSDDDSDADSGVLDPSGGNCPTQIVKSSDGMWCLFDGFIFQRQRIC